MTSAPKPKTPDPTPSTLIFLTVQVLTEEVAAAQLDLVEILDTAQDMVDKKLKLLATSQHKTEVCTLTVDVDALAALRALSVANVRVQALT